MGLIVTNIILVSSFGALLIPLFGLTTNAGNVFYASIFLVVQVMNEHYGRKAAFLSVWVGFGSLAMFVLLAQYSMRLTGAPDTGDLTASLQSVYSGVPRIALASMVAYLVSQSLNVWLFSYLRNKTQKRFLWLRSLLSSFSGQLVDSLLFFSIAFAFTVSGSELAEAMAVGFVVKMAVAIMGLPVLYASTAVMRIFGNSVRDRAGD